MDKKQILTSVVFGFLGAALYSILANHAVQPAFAKREQVLTASALNLVDDNGRLRVQIGFSKEGPPGIWLMDEKGVARLSAGLYPDGSAHLGLQDQNGLMIQLMRSYGPQQTPLLIFKNKGQDEMIMGLNPTSNPRPFMMSYDNKRQKKVHFGQYDGP